MRLLLGLLAAARVRMRASRPVAIERAPRDQVITVRGVAVPRDLLEAPLSGAPCVYYRYSVEEWRPSRLLGETGGGFWQLAEHDEAIAEFYVDDGTARAIVAPGDARVWVDRRPGDAKLDLSERRRVHELLIEPGDELLVTGHADEVADLLDEGRGYRATAQRLLLRAPEAMTLEIRLLRKRPPGGV
jgi:hypothetical protein